MNEYNLYPEKHFFSIGISYKKADANLRGKYAFLPESVPALVKKARQNEIKHFFAVSTCNRTELYAFAHHETDIVKLWCQFSGGNEVEIRSILSVKKDFEAVSHLFRVGAGLESQIIGDFEIIGQIKIWFNRFKKQNTTNAFLERLVNTTIQISKKIKHQTTLSSGSTSVSYAAVHYILTRVKNPSSKKIILLGTGKIGRNTCENLLKHTGHNQITLINRTRQSAENFANKFEVKLKGYEELEKEVNNSDILIVATSAIHPTLKKEHIKTDNPLLIIDLSVPSNVESSLKDLSNITVMGVDKLSMITNQNIKKRNEQIPLAEQIIENIGNDFKDWLETRKFVPYLQAFRKRLENINDTAHHSLKKKNNSEEKKEVLAEKVIQKLTDHLANYLLKNKENAEEAMETINKVFKVTQ